MHFKLCLYMYLHCVCPKKQKLDGVSDKKRLTSIVLIHVLLKVSLTQFLARIDRTADSQVHVHEKMKSNFSDTVFIMYHSSYYHNHVVHKKTESEKNNNKQQKI